MVQKSKYVSHTQLKLGHYDAIGAFNVGLKSSILIFEKHYMIPGQHFWWQLLEPEKSQHVGIKKQRHCQDTEEDFERLQT